MAVKAKCRGKKVRKQRTACRHVCHVECVRKPRKVARKPKESDCHVLDFPSPVSVLKEHSPQRRTAKVATKAGSTLLDALLLQSLLRCAALLQLVQLSLAGSRLVVVHSDGRE